jgi:hypothetical protein
MGGLLRMVPSLRTPEGDPGRCAICGHDYRLDPSSPGRDAPCPSCGHLIYLSAPGISASELDGSFVLQIGEMRFGPVPPDIEETVKGIIAAEGEDLLVDRIWLASSWEEFVTGGDCE